MDHRGIVSVIDSLSLFRDDDDDDDGEEKTSDSSRERDQKGTRGDVLRERSWTEPLLHPTD